MNEVKYLTTNIKVKADTIKSTLILAVIILKKQLGLMQVINGF